MTTLVSVSLNEQHKSKIKYDLPLICHAFKTNSEPSNGLFLKELQRISSCALRLMNSCRIFPNMNSITYKYSILYPQR